MKIAYLSCVALFAGGMALATRPGNFDLNVSDRGPQFTPEQIQALVRVETDRLAFRPAAVVVIPGSYESYDLDLMVLNAYPSPITNVNLDTFRALNGKSLVIDQCWGQTPDVVLEYPLTYGRGPMVLEFDRFVQGEFRSIRLDPDTYTEPLYPTKLIEMAGSVVQLAFKNGARAVGRLEATDFGLAVYLQPAFVPTSEF